MQMLKQLRRVSLRKVLAVTVILIAASVAVFFIFSGPSVFKSLFPKTLAELDPEDLEGTYVKDEIYFLYGQYAEEEEYRDNRRTGKITGAQYLTDLDDVYYIGLFGHEKDLDALEDMMDACRQYVNGEISGEQVPVLPVKGTLRAMDSQLSRYYWDMAEGDQQLKTVMLPYYLDMGQIGNQRAWLAWVMLAVATALLVTGLIPLIKALKGGYQKKLLKTLDAMGDRETGLERLEQFYESNDPVCGVRMNQDFIFFQNGAASVLLRPWDLVWAYQSTTQHRTNGIPTGKTYAAILRTMDGSQYTLGMKETEVQQLLAAFQEALPGVVLGYSKELEVRYQRDRGAFAAHWEEIWPGCTGRSETGAEEPV